MPNTPVQPISLLLYDGACGLCNRLVRFILPRDDQDRFRFAPLHSPLAASDLARYGLDPAQLETVCILAAYGTPAERLLVKSEAAVYALRQIGGAWKWLAILLRLVPRPLRDWAYDQVARRRYRIFGRYDSCPLPSPEDRPKFLDT